jgi:hypothetical protein
MVLSLNRCHGNIEHVAGDVDGAVFAAESNFQTNEPLMYAEVTGLYYLLRHTACLKLDCRDQFLVVAPFDVRVGNAPHSSEGQDIRRGGHYRPGLASRV